MGPRGFEQGRYTGSIDIDTKFDYLSIRILN
jgi:hypothetical protein